MGWAGEEEENKRRLIDLSCPPTLCSRKAVLLLVGYLLLY